MKNDWIEWRGGECPVPVGTRVDVRHKGGSVYTNQRAGVYGLAAYSWAAIDSPGCIVAYRLSNTDLRQNNGGKRSNAGRKPTATPKKNRSVRMTDASHEKYLRLGGQRWFDSKLDAEE